jgi:NitT/TauT family transport system permease protein
MASEASVDLLAIDPPAIRTRRAPSGSLALTSARLRKILLPILVLVAALAAWQYVTTSGLVSRLILASPTAILGAFVTSGGELLANAGITLTEALTGFAIGNTAGLCVAILFVHSDLARRTIFPVAIGAEAIPIVAVVPVLILWLGNGMAPKMFITSFLTFFPMLINALRGLRSADAEVNELLYTLSATPRQRLFMVRLPASVPFLFNALRLSACACVVSAIVGEWLAAEAGLGHLIVLYGTMYKVPEIWATALLSTGMSLALFGLVVAAEKLATPWRRRFSAPSS